MAKLAIKGGTPVGGSGFPGWPQVNDRDINTIKEIYASSKFKDGYYTDKIAARFNEYCGTSYCIPVANGTVSLEMILRGLGIGRGDEVIIPPYTFIATLSSIVFCGIKPVFADICSGSYNISAKSAADKITPATKAIIAVAVGGRPPDMDALAELATERGIHLIADAAQAVGSEWQGVNIGKYGIAASFSCQNTKNLNSGEGGFITTDNEQLYSNIMTMLQGGRDRRDGQFVSVGFDNGMSEFQAGILDSQFDRLDEQIALRMDNAAYLDKRINEIKFAMALDDDARITKNSYHLYIFKLKNEILEQLGVDRGNILSALNAEGFAAGAGYAPLYNLKCVSSDYTKRIIGSDICVSPLRNCETASYNEGVWLFHTYLLGDKTATANIADALEKIYENVDELRG